MDSTTFMGYLITAVLSLLGGAGVIATIIVKPLIKLNSKITELDVTIKSLGEGDESKLGKIERRLEKHGMEIDGIKNELKGYEGRISKMEAKKSR